MIKRTLIAIAVAALLVSSAQAALDIVPLPFGDSHAIKVDGSDNVRWPWEYKALDVCVIPIKMQVGMYVQVIDCKKKKIVLKQVDCTDMSGVTEGAVGNKADTDYPCYHGCTDFNVRANFEVKMGTSLEKVGDTIDSWSAYYKGGDVVPGDGEFHNIKVCVAAWKSKIYKAAPGDEVDVGKLHITVKPN